MKHSLWKKLMNRNYEDEVDELNIITSNKETTEGKQEKDNKEEDNEEENLEEGNP